MSLNIASTLAEVAHTLGDKTALIHRRGRRVRRYSFQELNGLADAYGHGLAARNIGRGERVMLMVKPSMEFVALTFALFKIGAVVILIDPGMGYRNMLRCIGSVKPAVFIGIPKAQLFRRLFPDVFATVRATVCVGNGFGLFGKTLQGIADFTRGPLPCMETREDDLAAIIFTTGSTGPPKGVRYEHGMFHAQLRLIRDYYKIGPGEIDQPAFPLFALFSTALGACAVIPEMNPARPARVNPRKFIATINEYGVTYSFGSPAIWKVVSNYCTTRGIRLPTLKKVLMAGAPVPGGLVRNVKAIMDADGEVHTPYGATECLPIVSMTGTEIIDDTWPLTQQGRGTCVGRPLPGITVRVIPISDEPLPEWDDSMNLPTGMIGEIMVRGPVVTRAYENNDQENRSAKIKDGDTFWHRIGDVGYFDGQGRLWFCGRKTHRVVTAAGDLFTIPCEAVFNEHPLVSRSALVGVGAKGRQVPILIVEPIGKLQKRQQLFKELRAIACSYDHTRSISRFLIHSSFPVDIRHNAKIFREKLALWAAAQMAGKVEL